METISVNLLCFCNCILIKEYKLCDDRDPLLQVKICKKSFMKIISLFHVKAISLITVSRSGDPLTNMPSALF